MSLEENKALVRRIFEEGFNQNKPEVFDELIAPNYVNHDFPTPAPGPEGIKTIARMFLAAFPDQRATIEEEFAEGDTVITRAYFTSTYQGDFQGIAPTGSRSR